MSGSWRVGEEKGRPGVYRRHANASGSEITGAAEHVGLAVVSGTWGPLNKPVITNPSDDVSAIIGGGKGANVISEMRNGGAKTIVVVRVGSGGTEGSVTLKDNKDADVVTLTTLYPTSRALTVTIKESLEDETQKLAIIHEGTKDLETVSFAAGESEVAGIVAAFAGSAYVKATKNDDGSKILKDVSQAQFSGGEDPTVNTEAYSAGFEASEEEAWNCVAVDSEEPAVHALLYTFINRKFEDGMYPYACVGEPKSIEVDTRIQHAAAFNDYKMHYVLNSWVGADGVVYEGYLAAARIAGMIIAVKSNASLTHSVIAGAVSLNEALKNATIKKALKSGCLVLSLSKNRQVWIEKAINTLTVLSADQDAGWKKIRRMKTRFELEDRIDTTLEALDGVIDNNDNGRATVMSAIVDILDAMAGEGKIRTGGTVTLDASNPPKGDSAWFNISVDDIDSMELIYLTYHYRFAPEDEE